MNGIGDDHKARQLADGCIKGSLSGDQTQQACIAEGLNCCQRSFSFIPACTWDEGIEVTVCRGSCQGTHSCGYDIGPINLSSMIPFRQRKDLIRVGLPLIKTSLSNWPMMAVSRSG